MIELRNVSKTFKRKPAVIDVSLAVPKGEIFGLLGHNGAGKSTAIGMMLGQVWPTSGELTVCGYDITRDRRQALQRVGAIFEAPAFYTELSGWKNLEILSFYTAPTSKARIQEVVEWVGLGKRIQDRVQTYSHGMKARLALGQALLPNPELLILDEPSNGLDPEGIHEMRLTIQRLHRELGLTILVSSHLLAEMEQVCHSIAVMNQGRKVFQGSISETRSRGGWIRLKAGNFVEATQILRESNMIANEREGQFILPSPGVATNQIVERLVERKHAVFEIAPEEETLESFYLGLMKK